MWNWELCKDFTAWTDIYIRFIYLYSQRCYRDDNMSVILGWTGVCGQDFIILYNKVLLYYIIIIYIFKFLLICLFVIYLFFFLSESQKFYVSSCVPPSLPLLCVFSVGCGQFLLHTHTWSTLSLTTTHTHTHCIHCNFVNLSLPVLKLSSQFQNKD